jgi:SAM-dependent methyltransferase
MDNSEKSWFDKWFDTPYYHILYSKRDDNEAEFFMNNLANFLHFCPKDTILDLACGKGRHAIYLNSKGLQVTGVDLSANSIAYASQFSNEKLHFARHDMREVYKAQQFDYVLNMFTSFGYFDTEHENQVAISAAAENLKVGGRLVVDFFNSTKVINNLLEYEQKTLENITFTITKKLSNNFIIKDIRFFTDQQNFSFQERVQAISLFQFEKYFEKANLKILNIFGSYDLMEFDMYQSDRIIFIAEKL